MNQRRISILSKLGEIVDDQLETAKAIKDAMEGLFDIYSEKCGHLIKIPIEGEDGDEIIKECYHPAKVDSRYHLAEDEDWVDCTCDNCPFFNELEEDGSFSDSLRREAF